MTRTGKRFALGAAAVVGFFAVVEVLAWDNVRRERLKRRYLGDQLFVVERGSGPPIVFIAGLEASTRYWGNGFDSLAASRRLLLVDALGFGRSPWPLHEPTMDDQMEWLRRTLVARGVTSRVTIVAHSYGTILAAEYAARHPGEVDRLILLGTPIFRGEDDASRRIRSMSSLGGLFSLNPIVAREACMLMGATRPILQRVLPLLSTKYRPEVIQDAVLHDWPSIHGAIQNVLLRSPVEPALGRTQARIVFVHGANDPVTPLDRVREASSRPGATLVVVPGDHHGYITESLDTILTAIREPLASE